MKVVYLDFDGVLHPEAVYWNPKRGAYLRDDLAAKGHTLFEHAQLLEELLAPYDDVRIVLSTSWVLQYRFSGAARRLPKGLQERCIGATFHTAMGRHAFENIPRGQQVAEDVRRRRPTAWLAIDDNHEGWPPHASDNLVITDPLAGISASRMLALLRQRLNRFR